MTPLKVFFIGCDKGAWQMRGIQIAQALPNARYGSKPNQIDWEWPDVIVLVKRAAEVWWKEAAASGKPIVWDVLDVWKQPYDNGRSEAEHLARIQQIARECRATLLVGATKAMAKAIGGVYLPHHSRLGLKPTPPRPRAKVVGYDGSPRYLGSWKGAIDQACAKLGLEFVIGPQDLAAVDVLVAFRGEEWDGWACREWKSGVKYVNAIAAGRPILTQSCAALREIRPCSVEGESHEALVYALEALIQPGNRDFPYEHGCERADEFAVQEIARQYERILQSAIRRAA